MKRPGQGPVVRPNHGVTLIEILVVSAVLAVLLALAVPSYQGYLQRGHRAEAARALLEAAACQERNRAHTGYYDTTRCLGGSTIHYRLLIEPGGQSKTLSYTLTARPMHRHRNDTCGALSLDHAGTRTTSGHSARWADCWSGR
ncbi:MAG: prepilin-type N-terminal cleavage/methylation domain-containing protein [Gammaproteobacteria bacterium]|nr:prepilin-type N-terminal cleavage/methylation domain-containing protein [Gammaproteobacteria bacterium]MBT8056604.1 prepilin-type N-terminal cleavage/methylation domain-containing protein [Gammaproteobacteria bacterium]